MADREVKETGKNDDGDIMCLCNGAESWSPRSKAEAIADINSGAHRYYVTSPTTGAEVDIIVVDDRGTGPYLRTVADDTTADNLDDLPDCNCGGAKAVREGIEAAQALRRPPAAPKLPAGRRVG